MHASRVRETILVVEDQPQLRGELCRILRRDGYVAIPARRGPEAQWCVERHGDRIDLLVAELAAPEADEYHLGIPIGRLFPRTPALFISRSAREEHVRRGLLLPHTPFLRTPFPPATLSRTVRALLDRRRSAELM
jgi:DNA-binding response OmpR family regulator